jgi:hypothetical protein
MSQIARNLTDWESGILVGKRLSVVKTSSSLQIKSLALKRPDVKQAVNATCRAWSTRAINVGPMSLSPAAKLLISIAAGVLSTDSHMSRGRFDVMRATHHLRQTRLRERFADEIRRAII